MRLVDDLMEPFRPIIDLAVWQLLAKGVSTINADSKRVLVQSLYLDLQTDSGKTPVLVAIQKLATSLAQVLLKERQSLELPSSFVLERSGTGRDE
jgi:CRISPR-associated protein Cas1